MTIMTIKKTERPYDYCRSLRLAFWFDANDTQSFELLANRYGQNILLLQLEILIFVFFYYSSKRICVTLTESAPMTMRSPLFCKINFWKINKATIYSNIAPSRCSNSSVNVRYSAIFIIGKWSCFWVTTNFWNNLRPPA